MRAAIYEVVRLRISTLVRLVVARRVLFTLIDKYEVSHEFACDTISSGRTLLHSTLSSNPR